MVLTDEQKLDRLRDLGIMMGHDMRANGGELSHFMKFFSVGALEGVGECNESWCDNCNVKNALGSTCDILIKEVMEDTTSAKID